MEVEAFSGPLWQERRTSLARFLDARQICKSLLTLQSFCLVVYLDSFVCPNEDILQTAHNVFIAPFYPLWLLHRLGWLSQSFGLHARSLLSILRYFSAPIHYMATDLSTATPSRLPVFISSQRSCWVEQFKSIIRDSQDRKVA